MDEPEEKGPFAWQPLTPRGVAAFASASLGRLMIVQLLVAFLLAGVFLWFLTTSWFPVIQQSIEQLPESGQIRSGTLDWPGNSPALLGENHFLAVTVDVSNSGLARSTAQVSVELARNGWRVYSLFGFADWIYPPNSDIPLNRHDLIPWWGAWKPVILMVAAVSWVGGLMITWWLLATLYCLPVRIAGFFTDRAVTLRSSWRLSAAALLPGAMFMGLCILMYRLAYLDLLRLALGWVIHLLVGWIYLVLALLSLPRTARKEQLKGNPFTPAAPEAPRAASADSKQMDPEGD
jgi:hypothetical protein